MRKKTLILIISIIIVILAVVFFVFAISSKNNNGKKEVVQSSLNLVKPKIKLTQTPSGPTDKSVTINIAVEIDGDNTVESITLPNGEIVNKNTATYEVTENGQYTFSAKGSNGETETSSINIDNINKSAADNPYIPEGFSKVETNNNEIVIEDKYKNQFVWVPVKSGSPIRNTSKDEKYIETDSTANALVNSIAKYYGFYIARYESSKYEESGIVAAKSVKDEIPWSNVSYQDAYNASVNAARVYKYSGVKTALLNSYAWDTTLDWLNKTTPNYSTNTSYSNNEQGIILKTGANEIDQINSVCDMAGNLREWTTEIYYPSIEKETDDEENKEEVKEDEETEIKAEVTYRVVRGGSANINKTANSHIGQPENMSDIYWGFRMILYKD